MPAATPDPLAGRIFSIRGQRVVLDADLARLYGVPTFRFNEAIKRNAEKFSRGFSVPTYAGRICPPDGAIYDIGFACC